MKEKECERCRSCIVSEGEMEFGYFISEEKLWAGVAKKVQSVFKTVVFLTQLEVRVVLIQSAVDKFHIFTICLLKQQMSM